jgi:hypothetical protein
VKLPTVDWEPFTVRGPSIVTELNVVLPVNDAFPTVLSVDRVVIPCDMREPPTVRELVAVLRRVLTFPYTMRGPSIETPPVVLRLCRVIGPLTEIPPKVDKLLIVAVPPTNRLPVLLELIKVARSTTRNLPVTRVLLRVVMPLLSNEPKTVVSPERLVSLRTLRFP